MTHTHLGVTLTGDSPKVRARQAVEVSIAAQIIDDVLAHGKTISVNEGEETTLSNSHNKQQILAAMFTTVEDTLIINNRDGSYLGWISLIYGNSGWDVIHDYTSNLEPFIKNANALAESLS